MLSAGQGGEVQLEVVNKADGCPGWEEVEKVCKAAVLEDGRTGEIVLLHRPSRILIVSDLLYKSRADVVGPGGAEHRQ